MSNPRNTRTPSRSTCQSHRAWRNHAALAGALGLGLTCAASAQGLSLDKSGGGIGGSLALRLQGNPGEPYFTLFDLAEQATQVPALGISLAISDRSAGSSLGIPGFVGRTNAQGQASATVALPNDPALANFVVSLQAIAGQSQFRVSNLVRVTPQVRGTFAAPLNQPSLPIAGGAAAVLADGSVLFAGGSGPAAQRYDSRTEQWELAGVTFGVGALSQATALADGRILFTGGLDLTTGQPTAAAAVYDPVAQATTTLTMARPRAGHGASLMGNGKVLITGGLAAFDLQDPLSLLTGIQQSTEVFDPATGTFTQGPNMLEARALHTSTTLTSGQVLIAGGLTLLPIVNVPTVSATAYRFNPATNSFGLPATFPGARFLHSAAPLSNGKVLLAGGLNIDFTAFLASRNVQDLRIDTRSDCQVYSPSLLGFGTFATVNGMQEGRAGAAIAPLPNGGALIAGGFSVSIDPATAQFGLGATATADVMSGANQIAATRPMAAPRLFPVAVNLHDGTIMVVGGGPAGAEIYQN